MNSRNTKLITVFLFAALLFNFPLIGIFLKNSHMWFVPVSWIYIFAVWLVLIFWVRQTADVGFNKQELVDKRRKTAKTKL